VFRLQPNYSRVGVERVFAGAASDFPERLVDGLRKAGSKE
jgi:hypothetical protein